MTYTRKDVERLIQALEFYANPSNWGRDDWGVLGVIQSPEYGKPGGKARRALRPFRAKRGRKK